MIYCGGFEDEDEDEDESDEEDEAVGCTGQQ